MTDPQDTERREWPGPKPWMHDGRTPWFPDGFHCQHGYPPGEMCPACGELPSLVPFDDDHDPDCGCFACEEDA